MHKTHLQTTIENDHKLSNIDRLIYVIDRLQELLLVLMKKTLS